MDTNSLQFRLKKAFYKTPFSLSMLRAVFVLAFLLSVGTISIDAWTMTSTASSFGGKGLSIAGSCFSTSSVIIVQNGSTTVMKKGKANVPPMMRGNYKRQKEMSQMQQQIIAASKPGDDGLPVFNLFVRTKTQKLWYPCGSFKGDERSAALSKAWSEGSMLAGISKKQLDGGIAGSLFSDLKKLKETVCRAYLQLRKARDEMEFGYRLAFDGLPEEKSKEIFSVEPKENKGPLDGLKNIFS